MQAESDSLRKEKYELANDLSAMLLQENDGYLLPPYLKNYIADLLNRLIKSSRINPTEEKKYMSDFISRQASASSYSTDLLLPTLSNIPYDITIDEETEALAKLLTKDKARLKRK